MSTMNDYNQPLVSVIVPVWNPGPGISRCIESLRNQTLNDIEMIFVDDCGTDDSMDKVREAAAEDHRIRILNNETNIGSGPSRNRGIESARGEYLSFVDPDDYIAPDFLMLLYQEAAKQSFDIIKGSWVLKREGRTYDKSTKLNQSIRNGLDAKTPLYVLFTGEHWTAIYRKIFILQNKIRYGTSARAQDTTFLLQVGSKTDSISIIDDARYYFCERLNSATHTRDNSYIEAYLQSTKEKIDYALIHLQENISSRMYFGKQFLVAINAGGRFIHDSNYKDALAKYAHGIRLQLLRLPYHNALASESFSIYALKEHGYLLPSEAYSLNSKSDALPIQYAKLVERWVDFLLNNPKDTDACWNDLKPLIIRAYKETNRIPNNNSSIEEIRRGGKLLKKQIKRLPWGLRLQLASSEKGNRVMRAIARIIHGFVN